MTIRDVLSTTLLGLNQVHTYGEESVTSLLSAMQNIRACIRAIDAQNAQEARREEQDNGKDERWERDQ